MSLTEENTRIQMPALALEEEPYPYETATFHHCWWRYMAAKFDIPVKNRDLLIYRKPVLKGALTLREMRIAGWNSSWTQDLTSARLDELEELGKATDWDYFRLTWSEHRRHLQALEQLAQKGFPMLQIPAPVHYVIDLSQGFDGYLESLSHNGRKGLAKKVRRAQALNPRRVEYPLESDIEPFFSEFFFHHIAYWDSRVEGGSYFNQPEEREFIVQWAKALHQEGRLILERIWIGDDIVNYGMGIRFGNTVYGLLTINTGHHHAHSPGLIGLYLRAKELADQGVTRFNMGPGDYFYKIQSTNSRELCQDLIIANPRSLRGRAYLTWLKRRQKKLEATSLESTSTVAES